jgi:hypothetical protein
LILGITQRKSMTAKPLGLLTCASIGSLYEPRADLSPISDPDRRCYQPAGTLAIARWSRGGY